MSVQNKLIDPNFARDLELSEAMYWSKYYCLKSELNPAFKRIGSGMALALPEIDILAMNRIIGWGWTEPMVELNLSEIIDFYREKKIKRFFLQLSPLTPQYEKICEKLNNTGFVHYNNWSKVWRALSGFVPPINSFLKVGQIEESKAKIFADIIATSFGWQDPRIHSFLRGSVGQQDYFHYAAMLQNKVIAVGAMHIYKNIASMAFAATLPNYRGLGAQSLLIQHRIQAARKMGVKFLVSETAEQREDNPSPSYRNLQRFGFNLAYQRENWIYEFKD